MRPRTGPERRPCVCAGGFGAYPVLRHRHYSGCAPVLTGEYCPSTQVEVASEYRYRESVPNPNTLVVTISQSGETADT